MLVVDAGDGILLEDGRNDVMMTRKNIQLHWFISNVK
jgi:hypothetical protein